ncbi:pilus assembly protein PilM [Vibrio sp.]|nr:pilus assembly protein PilM [Vibrio sp.]
MSKRIITGIDIRCDSILAVTVARKYDTYQLQMIQDIPTNRDIVSENIPLHHQLLVNILAELKKKRLRKGREITLCVPESAVICKTVDVPSYIRGRKEEGPAVLRAFAKSAPLPIEELAIDYEQVGSRFQVFATRKAEVLSRKQLVKNAGLKLGLIESEKNAFHHAHLWVDVCMETQQSLLIDWGKENVRFGFSDGDHYVYRCSSFADSSTTNLSQMAALFYQECQRFLSLNPSIKPQATLIYSSVELPQEIEACAKQLLDIKIYRLESLFNHHAVLIEQNVNEPFLALGSALSGFHAIEEHRYVA